MYQVVAYWSEQTIENSISNCQPRNWLQWLTKAVRLQEVPAIAILLRKFWYFGKWSLTEDGCV